MTFATAGNLAGEFAVTATTQDAAAPIAPATPQTTAVRNLFAEPLAVAILDAFGNRVPGVPLTYLAASAAATAALASRTAVSDADGIALLLALASPRAGSYEVVAEVSGFTERRLPASQRASRPRCSASIWTTASPPLERGACRRKRASCVWFRHIRRRQKLAWKVL